MNEIFKENIHKIGKIMDYIDKYYSKSENQLFSLNLEIKNK